MQSTKKSLTFRIVAYSIPFLLLLSVCGVIEIVLRRTWAAGRYWHSEYGIQGGIKIERNHLGLRGPSPSPRAEGEFRVVAIGDSTTFGMAEAYEDIWPTRLEQQLRIARPTQPFTVINAAGLGRHPHWMLNNIDHLRQFDPDLVIYQLTLNDVVLRTERLDQERFQASLEEATLWEQLRWRTTGLHYDLGRWRVFGLLQSMYRIAFPLEATSQLTLAPYQFNSIGLGDADDNAQAWQDTLDSLSSIAAELEKHDTQFLLTMLPYQFQISSLPEDDIYGFNDLNQTIDPADKLAVLAEQKGFQFFNLTPAFQAARAAMIADEQPFDPLFQPLDFVHPNGAGYGLIADTIVPIVIEQLLESQNR